MGNETPSRKTLSYVFEINNNLLFFITLSSFRILRYPEVVRPEGKKLLLASCWLYDKISFFKVKIIKCPQQSRLFFL